MVKVLNIAPLIFVFLTPIILSCKSVDVKQEETRDISSDSETRCEDLYAELNKAIQDEHIKKTLKLVDDIKNVGFISRFFCSEPIDHALTLATKLEKHEIVFHLLKRDDVNVNYRKHAVEAPPLMIAIRNKDTETAKMLIAHPDINLGIMFTGRYAMHFAVLHEHEEIIPVLLDHPEINVNKRDFHGESALQIAHKSQNTKIISLIEEKVAELEDPQT